MTSRLEHLESLLADYDERLAEYEKQLLRYERLEHSRIKLLIRDLREEMRPVEEERWQILAANSAQLEITESAAEVIVGEQKCVPLKKNAGRFWQQTLRS